MSSTINKIKDAITPGHNNTTTTNTHAEGTHGPHSSRAANAADPRIDSDRDGGHIGQDTHHSTHHTTGTGVGTGVGHTSHTTGGTGFSSTGPATTTAGPHSSNLANKADPRVDSDRSGGTHLGGGTGLGGTTHTQHAGTSGLGNPGTYNAGHTAHTTAGPHSSDLANKADPRVDSDRSNTYGGGLTGNTHGTTHGTTHSSGLTGTTHTTAGPHSSDLANKADPRVDSDRSHTHGGGLTGTHAGNTHTTHTGTAGGISHSTNAGPHNSNLANKADPRVDSDLDSTGNRHGAAKGGPGSHATPGSGTAQNTAGPHNSDLLNKLDPRVDSDLSGGKTYGGNKTHQ